MEEIKNKIRKNFNEDKFYKTNVKEISTLSISDILNELKGHKYMEKMGVPRIYADYERVMDLKFAYGLRFKTSSVRTDKQAKAEAQAKASTQQELMTDVLKDAEERTTYYKNNISAENIVKLSEEIKTFNTVKRLFDWLRYRTKMLVEFGSGGSGAESRKVKNKPPK